MMSYSACLQKRVIRFCSKDIQVQFLEPPEWVLIYYLKKSNTEYRCNICEQIIKADKHSPELLEHIKENHKEVYDLHKDNPFSSVGFRIEFLQVVKGENADSMNREVIIGEVCEAATEEIAKPIYNVTESSDIPTEINEIVVSRKQKTEKPISLDNRKRSWVWKYFEKVNNFMYRCRFCRSILSIKGCNTNNLNRHMRTRHPRTFSSEIEKNKKDEDSTYLEFEQVKDDSLSEKDGTECYVFTDTASATVVTTESPNQKQRSWVWMYFDRVSSTLAQCKLCKRNISHGGNATGNMNRHLKMRHHKTADSDHTWIWKVFDVNEEDFYTCKICQYKCLKTDDLDQSINTILEHLKVDHGVISGDQIITGKS